MEAKEKANTQNDQQPSTSSPVSINNSHRNPSTRRPRTPPSAPQGDGLWPSLLSLVGLLLSLLLSLLRLVLGLLASLLGLVLCVLAGLFGLALELLAALAGFGVLVFAVLEGFVVAVFGVLLGFLGFGAGVVDVLLCGVAGGLVARAGVVGDEG
jgi:hypothetical protein